MELTPIKVRGKRCAKGEPLVAASSKYRKVPKQERQRRLARARLPRASNIEKSMPLEILERIFWYSENVNFPRSSPRLGWLLSGRSTLRRTFLSAFEPFWHLGAGSAASRSNIPSDSEDRVREEGDIARCNPEFQRDLLACSWTSIDMILDCWDIWVRRRGQGQTLVYTPIWDNWSPDSNTGSDPATRNKTFKTAREYFYHDYSCFCKAEPGNFGWRSKFLFPGTSWNSLLERMEAPTASSPEIPDELITGPWDERALQKYFWIAQTCARMSPHQTWELGLEGFRNALSDPAGPNLTVLRLLRLVGALSEWPTYVSKDELKRLGDDTSRMGRQDYLEVENMLILLYEETSAAERRNRLASIR